MDNWTALDWLLLAIFSLLALSALARLMLGYRRELIHDLRHKFAEERARQKKQKKAKKPAG